MILDHPLTAEDRAISQRNYLKYAFLNGFSYMCLAETIIILLAVQIQMPDILVTFLGAMMYIGFLLLPLGVRQTARLGAAQSQASFWVCRNVSALLVAVCAIISQYSPVFAWILLLAASFLFYGFRAAGVVMSQPLVGEITTEDDRSQLIGNAISAFYFSGVVALLLICFLLKLNSTIWMLCGIIVMGAAMGITSSRFIRAIRETDTFRQTASRPLLPQWKIVKKNPMIRQFLMVGFCRNLNVILLIPASVLYLKKGYGFSDMQAVLFSIGQICACFLFSWLSGLLIAKSGPRVAMFWGSVLCIFVSVFWIFSPVVIGPLPIFLSIFIFILCGAAVAITEVACSCYFLMVVPKEQQVAGSVATNLIQGIGAGCGGIGIAGVLMWLAEHSSPFFLEYFRQYIPSGSEQAFIYKLFFLFIIPVQIFAVVQALRLKIVITDFREKHGSDGVESAISSGRSRSH